MGIADRDFDVAFWGCDPTEVRSFFGEVDAAHKILDARMHTLRAQMVELREAARNAPRHPVSRPETTATPPLGSMRRGTSEALVAARTDAVATMRETSRRCADIVGSARQEAARLTEETRQAIAAEAEDALEEAHQRRARLDEETAELDRERDELAASLQRTVEMMRGLASGLGTPPNGGVARPELVYASMPAATNGRARTETEEHHGN